MEGWVDLGSRLHAEMIYPPTDGHLSKGLSTLATKLPETGCRFRQLCCWCGQAISSNPAVHDRESNSQPVDHKFDALTCNTTKPPYSRTARLTTALPWSLIIRHVRVCCILIIASLSFVFSVAAHGPHNSIFSFYRCLLVLHDWVKSSIQFDFSHSWNDFFGFISRITACRACTERDTGNEYAVNKVQITKKLTIIYTNICRVTITLMAQF